MAEEIVRSEVFPNLMIDSKIKVSIDNVLRKLKESPDSDVRAFVAELSYKDYPSYCSAGREKHKNDCG